METVAQLRPRLDWRSDGQFIWMKPAIAGWCDDQNVDAMAIAIESMPAGAVVEIGSFVGRSTCMIARLLELVRTDAPFYSIDDWFFQGHSSGAIVSEHVTHDNWRAYTERSFRVNVEYFAAKRPRHLKMRSDDFFIAWKNGEHHTDIFEREFKLGGPIAFAYVDGDHRYEPCRRDVENVLSVLAPGGFLFLDDSYDGIPFGSGQVGKELLDRTGLRLMGRFPNLLFQRVD
jgi:hypothetical protein